MQLVNIVVRLLYIEETKPERCVLSCSFVYRFLVCSFALSLAHSFTYSLTHSLSRGDASGGKCKWTSHEERWR